MSESEKIKRTVFRPNRRPLLDRKMNEVKLTGCSPYRTPEHRKWIRDRNKEYALDRKEAAEIERMGIVKYPMDLPSLHRAVIYGNRARAVGVFTTGYDWLDKPHRVAFSAIEEVRALRKFILANPSFQGTPHREEKA